MIVKIDRNGILTIQAETEVEALALDQTFKGVELKDVHKKIIIKTALKE